MDFRLYVDFNTMMMDEKERVPIRLDEKHPSHIYILGNLEPGMIVVLFDEEFEVKATLDFDQEFNAWMATPDWSTRKDL